MNKVDQPATTRKGFRRLQLPISERRTLIVIGDIAIVLASTLIALRVWAFVGDIAFDLSFVLGQTHWFVILSLLWLSLSAANNFNDLALSADWMRSQTRLLQITLQLLFIYLVIFFLSPRDALPRLFILYYAVASYVLIALWRLARPFLVGWTPLRRRALVVGVGWSARTMIEAIHQHAPDDYEIVGIVDEANSPQPDDLLVEADVVGTATACG